MASFANFQFNFCCILKLRPPTKQPVKKKKNHINIILSIPMSIYIISKSWSLIFFAAKHVVSHIYILYLYLSKSWSIIFIVAMLLLSNINVAFQSNSLDFSLFGPL